MDLAATGPLTALGLVTGCAVFWLHYWDLKDRDRPEPRRLLGVAFLLGIGAAAAAHLLFRLAAWAGLPDTPGDDASAAAVFCFLVVGPVEEGAKFAFARVVAFRWRAFDEVVDGLVYGVAVALGFASVENLVYLPHLSTVEGVLRTIAAPFTHTLFAAVWGLMTAHGMLRSRGIARVAWSVGGLAVASSLHGLYDYLILAHGATRVAALVVAVLWVGVVLAARRAVRRHVEDARGAT